MKELHIITDLQFGSTGKGLFAGYLARRLQADTLITAWGPNAGHTFVDHDGKKYVHTMLANGIVSSSVERVLIGPGSVINPNALLAECINANFPVNKLFIHESAAIVLEHHRYQESEYGFKIGSTMKGTAAAVIQKLRRDPDKMNVAKAILPAWPELFNQVVSEKEYQDLIHRAEVAVLEGAQGYSLSINKGFYPYTTSRDCTTMQLLSDCGLPWPYYKVKIYGVCRTYPIRVANRFDRDGVMIGTSGPCYPDQQEITWESIGLQPELTTVTKLPRRLFTFSKEQIERAIMTNGVGFVFLNFCNYLKSESDLERIIETIETTGAKVFWTGWGPTVKDIRKEDVNAV